MDQLVESDPFGKSSSLFYTGAETAVRPEITRFHERVKNRYPFRTTENIIIVPDIGERPFSDTASTIITEVRRRTPEDTILLFVTPMGVVPWELEHVHPAQQCIFSKDVDPQTLNLAKHRLLEILEMIAFNNIVWFERESPTNQFGSDLGKYKVIRTTSASETIDALDSRKVESSDWHLRKLRALLMYQWGKNAGDVASVEGIQVVFSRSTGKIRHVTLEKEIIFTVVPTTGLLTPTYRGGEVLLQHNIDERFLITMAKDASEFVARGKSALAKFVIDADSNVKAGEEVLVVDENRQLLGTGRTLLSGSEMLVFNRGVAVVIRHSSQR
jgi:predicted RNA-binding protein (TIGR00451 family)